MGLFLLATAVLWDASAPLGGLDPKSTGLLRAISPLRGELYGVAWSPDGARFAVACQDKTARLYDAARGAEVLKLAGHDSPVRRVAFSPDGRTLATGDDAGGIRLWDPATGKEVRALAGQGGRVRALAFGADGRTLVSSGTGWAQVWEVQSGAAVRPLVGDCATVGFSPRGDRVVTGGHGGARVLEPREWAEERVLPGSEYVLSGGFSRDGRRWVSGGADQRVKIWDLEKGKLEREIGGHTGQVYGAAFLSGGRQVLSAGDDTARLWDASTGAELARWAHEKVTALAVHPNGRGFVTAGLDRQIRLWGQVPRAPERKGEPGFLGIGVQPARGGGAAVLSVLPDGPAHKAGLRHGDVIRKVGSAVVKDAAGFLEAIGRLAEGEEVEIHFERGGAERSVFVTPGKRPSAEPGK